MAISLYELAQRVNSAMPLGTIVPYYGTDEPSGWKICDGRSCAGTDLAKKLGISVVPDLRGRFIRMIGGNAAGMGVVQEDCIRNIAGKITTIQFNRNNTPSSSGALYYTDQFRNGYAGGSEYCGSIAFDASKSVPTGPENRPINMAFNYIIKVVGTNVILYYVSNIIYKAKAHICRTFSFVKSFQREVRNSMSISLKNHEDRITSLENIKGSGVISSVWSGNLITGSISLNLSTFDIIIIKLSLGGDYYDNISHVIPKLMFGHIIRFCQNSTFDFKTTVNAGGISIGYNYYNNSKITDVYGLKLYYNFSYNIYRLTQILLNSPFFWSIIFSKRRC